MTTIKKIAEISEIKNGKIVKTWGISDPYDGVLEKTSSFYLSDEFGFMSLGKFHQLIIDNFIELLVCPDLGANKFKHGGKEDFEWCTSEDDRKNGYTRCSYIDRKGKRVERVFSKNPQKVRST